MARHAWAQRLALGALAVTACARPGGPTPAPTSTRATATVPSVEQPSSAEQPSITELPGRGVAIAGHGAAETEDVSPEYGGGLPIGIDVVSLTHDGRSSFIVTAVQGDQSQLLTSAIGAYTGQRPLVVQGPVSFQVTADGAWTLTIAPMSSGAAPEFSGRGDAVSPYFAPPGPSTWNVSHDGQSSFLVYAHCLGGSMVVEDRAGAFQDSPRMEFQRGPCFWEVRADGTWSLAPSA